MQQDCSKTWFRALHFIMCAAVDYVAHSVAIIKRRSIEQQQTTTTTGELRPTPLHSRLVMYCSEQRVVVVAADGWMVANRKAQTVVELGTACSQHG